MIRTRLSRRRRREPAELNVTAFMNLMVALVPFLLITAVFAHMAVLDINVPTAGDLTQEQRDKLRLEIVVHDDGFVVGDSQRVIAAIQRTDAGAYDYAQLSDVLQRIKKANPAVQNARVLLEPDTKYNILVHVMDTVRMAAQPNPNNPGATVQIPLFPKIALGEAPDNNADQPVEAAE